MEGIEIESGPRLSQVISQELPGLKISVSVQVMEEVARGIPSVVAASAENPLLISQDIFMFRNSEFTLTSI